jgi:hypothetical protein
VGWGFCELRPPDALPGSTSNELPFLRSDRVCTALVRSPWTDGLAGFHESAPWAWALGS